MVINKYILVVVDYDTEKLETHSLKDVYEVHKYFTPEVADSIIKSKKYKGSFEEALLLEIDVASYFEGKE